MAGKREKNKTTNALPAQLACPLNGIVFYHFRNSLGDQPQHAKY
jgi:hypothetical protein